MGFSLGTEGQHSNLDAFCQLSRSDRPRELVRWGKYVTLVHAGHVQSQNFGNVLKTTTTRELPFCHNPVVGAWFVSLGKLKPRDFLSCPGGDTQLRRFLNVQFWSVCAAGRHQLPSCLGTRTQCCKRKAHAVRDAPTP